MKETTKTFIDGICVGGSLTYLAILIVQNYGLNTLLAGIGILGFGYCTLMIGLAAEEERRWRRKNYEKGTHDYYGNKIEDENE